MQQKRIFSGCTNRVFLACCSPWNLSLSREFPDYLLAVSLPVCLFFVTSNSDDNLLKNIELFDKLVLRFNGRVLFVKDVLGDEICCWSFYGEGRKIAEVCCTSIVYATEKKQTKVSITRLHTISSMNVDFRRSGIATLALAV